MVSKYLEPVANWMEKFKPSVKEITLKRADYDLIKRWPKAAELLHFRQAPDGTLRYKGFTLKFDKKPPRYSKDEAA
jgi:hypothetical protein